VVAAALVVTLVAAGLVVASLVRVPLVVSAPASVDAGPAGRDPVGRTLVIALPQRAVEDVRPGQPVVVRAGATDVLRAAVTKIGSPRELGTEAGYALPLQAGSDVALARVTSGEVAVGFDPFRGRILLAQVVVGEETALERIPLIGRLAS
jgi:hypothetical protein